MFSYLTHFIIHRIELVIFAKDENGNDVKAEVLVNKIKEESTIGQLKKKMKVDVMEAKVKRELLVDPFVLFY